VPSNLRHIRAWRATEHGNSNDAAKVLLWNLRDPNSDNCTTLRMSSKSELDARARIDALSDAADHVFNTCASTTIQVHTGWVDDRISSRAWEIRLKVFG
jgi:hypothetical protein